MLSEQRCRALKVLLARAVYEGGLPLSFVDRPATRRFTQVGNITRHDKIIIMSQITRYACS
jgi:hypothetical protein